MGDPLLNEEYDGDEDREEELEEGE